jgi:hypothetical protein
VLTSALVLLGPRAAAAVNHGAVAAVAPRPLDVPDLPPRSLPA